MLKSIRILLAVAASLDYEIWQMDVKTAFLNGNLNEDIYMQQPEGFKAKGKEHMVCKLQRSIYGLKQASRSWNIRFDQAITSFGFEKSPDEPCVYKRIQAQKVVFLVLYVDDILLIGNDKQVLSGVKDWLHKQFDMKTWEKPTIFLESNLYETGRISCWHYLKPLILIKFLSGLTWKIPKGDPYPLDMEFIFLRSNHQKLLSRKNV